jgi:hypothetical protein
MSDIKWVTISVMIVFLWIGVFVLWIAYTNPLIGAVLTSILFHYPLVYSSCSSLIGRSYEQFIQ